MITYEDKKFIDTIIEAVNNDKLVIFVGAGLSRLCGLPSWEKFAESLIDYCADDEKCKFDYGHSDLVKSKVTDKRELIAISKDILYSSYNNSDDEYYKVVKKIFDYSKITEKKHIENRKKIINLMASLSKTIVTTNVDEVLDVNRFIAYDECSFNTFKKNDIGPRILHIHGSIKNPCTMVFTNSDYLSRYNERWFRSAMNDFFVNDPSRVILFIGYGLNELQLLDFFVKPKLINEVKERRFLLQGYFQRDEKLYEVESKYYEKYGISLIAYDMDLLSYEKIINVLDFISDRIRKDSEFKPKHLEELDNIINGKIKKSSKDSFLNDFKISDNKTKCYILSLIYKSKNFDYWLKALIDDAFCNDLLFNLDGKIFKRNLDEVDLPYETMYLLLMYLEKNKNDKSIMAFIIDFVNKTFFLFRKKQELYNNYSLCSIMLKLVTSNHRILSLESSYNFINDIIAFSAVKYDWILFMSYNNNVLYKCKKSVCKDLILLILDCIYKSKNSNYYFEEFLDSYGDFVYKEYSSVVFEKSISLMKEEIENDYSYINLSMDCFEIIMEKKNEYDLDDTFIKVIINCERNMNDYYSKKIFDKFMKSSKKFYTNFAIFMANERFALFKDLFLSNLGKLICDKNYYSEIYLYMNNHKLDFSNEDIELIGKAIDKIIMDSDFLTKIYKYDMYMIFSNLDTDNYCKQMYKMVESSLTEEDVRKYKEYFTPIDRSKSVWTRIISHNLTIEDKNKILDLPTEDYIKMFENEDYNDDYFDARDVFEEYEKLNSIIENVLDNNVGELPFRFIESTINYILKTKEKRSIDDSVLKIISLYKLSKKEKREKLSITILHNLFYLYGNQRRLMTENASKIINNFIDSNIDIDSLNWNIEKYSKMNLNDLISNDAFMYVYIKLLCSNQNNWHEVKAKLLSLLNDERGNIIKAGICSDLHFAWYIDKEWIKSILKDIFITNNEVNIFSLIGFELSQVLDSQLICEMFDLGILDLIMNTELSFKNVYGYAARIIYGYLLNRIDERVLSSILKSRCFRDALLLLSQQNSDIERNESTIMRFKGLIELCLNTNLVENDFSPLIVKMVSFCCNDYIKNLIIKLVKKLSLFGTIAVRCDELSRSVEKYVADNEDKKDIIFCYLDNLKEHHLFLDEICDLYYTADWTGDIRGSQLKNKLGDINTELIVKIDKRKKKKK